MLAVLVTHLVHLAHLPLILAQPARIMNVDKLVKIAPIAARVVILHLTPAVVMTPQQPNAVILAIALKLAAQIAVRPGPNIIPVLTPVLRNVALVVTTVLTAVLRGLHHHLALAVIMRKPLVQHNVVIPATLVLKMLILVLV